MEPREHPGTLVPAPALPLNAALPKPLAGHLCPLVNSGFKYQRLKISLFTDAQDRCCINERSGLGRSWVENIQCCKKWSPLSSSQRDDGQSWAREGGKGCFSAG